jgi:hypothetical protein
MMPGQYGVLALAAGASLFVQFALFGRVVHRQELQADWGAIELGASSQALASALHKLMNDIPVPHPLERLLMGMHYPTLQERLESILSQGAASSRPLIPQKAFMSAYSLLVVGIVFWSARNIGTPDRSPANEVANPANIAHLENQTASR